VKSQYYAMLFLSLSALLFAPGSESEANAQNKHSTDHSGRQGGVHMSTKGSANSNAQWSADPTRGWVRAEERHELRKTNLPSRNNFDQGKPKVKGKAQGH